MVSSITSDTTHALKKKKKTVRTKEDFLKKLDRNIKKYERHGIDIDEHKEKLFKLLSFHEDYKFPIPLPKSVSINKDLLADFEREPYFTLYQVKATLESEDERYLSLYQGETVIGFSEVRGWIFAFKDDPNAKSGGFAPLTYLEEIQTVENQKEEA